MLKNDFFILKRQVSKGNVYIILKVGSKKGISVYMGEERGSRLPEKDYLVYLSKAPWMFVVNSGIAVWWPACNANEEYKTFPSLWIGWTSSLPGDVSSGAWLCTKLEIRTLWLWSARTNSSVKVLSLSCWSMSCGRWVASRYRVLVAPALHLLQDLKYLLLVRGTRMKWLRFIALTRATLPRTIWSWSESTSHAWWAQPWYSWFWRFHWKRGTPA